MNVLRLEVYFALFHFTAEILYRWDTLLLKYFIDGLFLYCSMLFIMLTCLL